MCETMSFITQKSLYYSIYLLNSQYTIRYTYNSETRIYMVDKNAESQLTVIKLTVRSKYCRILTLLLST